MGTSYYYAVTLTTLALASSVLCDCPIGTVRGPYTDDCYLYEATPVTWFEAEEECQGRAGHLASITNGITNSFLPTVLSKQCSNEFLSVVPNHWLGGSVKVIKKEKNWTWTDGNGFKYADWANGQGSSAETACLVLNVNEKDWYSVPCNERHPYICRVPPLSTSQCTCPATTCPTCPVTTCATCPTCPAPKECPTTAVPWWPTVLHTSTEKATTTEAVKPTTQEPTPSTQPPKPTTEAPEPSTTKVHTTTKAPKPTTKAPKPTTDAPATTTEAPKPSTKAARPTTEEPNPTTEAPLPSTEAAKPTTKAPQPTTKEPKPSTDAPKPSTAAPTPSTEAPIPSTEQPTPSTAEPTPSTKPPKPSTKAPVPTTEAPPPSTEEPTPSTAEPTPSTKAPVPTTEAPVPSTEAPKPSTAEPTPSTKAPAPTTTEPLPTQPSTRAHRATTKPPAERTTVVTTTAPSTQSTTTAEKCFEGWQYSPLSNKCYQVIDEPFTWSDAKDACEEQGSELASIHNELVNNWLVDYSYNNTMFPWAWTGLHSGVDCQSWQWLDQTPTDYFNWGKADIYKQCIEDPSKLKTCVGLVNAKKGWYGWPHQKWVAAACDWQHSALCQRDPLY